MGILVGIWLDYIGLGLLDACVNLRQFNETRTRLQRHSVGGMTYKNCRHFVLTKFLAFPAYSILGRVVPSPPPLLQNSCQMLSLTSSYVQLSI